MNKLFALTAAAVLGTAMPALADEKGGIELGMLTCHQTDRTNLIVWSDATYTCTFDRVKGDEEVYTGSIDKIGVDLTINKIETIKWTVIAPNDRSEPGALSGTYVGASADAAVGVGAGARALVGGGDNSFALQPVSLSGETGVGIAAGIERFKLQFNQ